MNGLEAQIDLRSLSTRASRRAKHFIDLTDSVNLIDYVNHFVYKGTQEFDDIYKALNELNNKQKEAQQEFLSDGVYPADEFRKKEQEILDMMDRYITRKETAREAGDTSSNSARRLAAMKEARNTLSERLSDDLKMPNITYANIADFGHFDNSEERETNAKLITGASMLDTAFSENTRKMASYADKLTAENLSKNIKPKEYYEMINVLRTHYILIY